MSETIKEQASDIMYRDDMVKYSVIVNRRRSIPEIKDGLKVVDRRVIYDMYSLGATSHTLKCARITGDTMGKFHPHSSSYGSLIVMGNWFSCKVPLIQIQGNSGTVMGDGPAAERYTEAKLSDFCMDCVVSDLRESKLAVDWKDNYTREIQEPEYLPVKVPLLLINGCFGIGVGMSSKIPPHNLVEVLEATRALLYDINYDPILVPDHCQALHLIDTDWAEICHTGCGQYTMRGIVKCTEENGYPVVHIYSLPDNVTEDKVVEKLLDLYDKKQLPMVKDIAPASKKEIDIRIVLKKGSDPNYVKQIIYAKTPVQSTFAVNFQAVDDINPRRFSYKEYLLSFIENRITTKARLYCNKMKDASTRHHKLETYIKVIKSGEIDNIIDMVKKQNTIDNNVLTEYLIKKCHITDIQAGFILETPVQRLSKGYLKKYEAEFADLTKKIELYKKIITDESLKYIKDEINNELLEIEKKYGEKRKCDVIKASDDDNIPRGTFKLIITSRNYIRKLPDTEKINTVRGDNPKFVMRVENTESVLLFDSMGKVFKLPICKVPLTEKSGAGTDIRILVRGLTANIVNMYYEPMIQSISKAKRNHTILVATKLNTIKRLNIEDFLNVNTSGLMYTKLKPDDEVVGAIIAPAGLDVIIYSKQKALRCKLKDISLFKRNATGSKAMNTEYPIEGICMIYPDADSLITITESGRINKFPLNLLSTHNRGSSGNNVIKLKETDNIYSLFGANENDIIRLTTANLGTFDVPVNSIKQRSSVAPGEKLSGFKSDSIVHCDVIKGEK